MSEELRIDIKSMTLPELTALMKEWGEPGFPGWAALFLAA